MEELLRSNDLVMISFLEALLSDAGVATAVFDAGMNVLDGNICAFPRRLMVHADDLTEARTLVREAGLAHALRNAR